MPAAQAARVSTMLKHLHSIPRSQPSLLHLQRFGNTAYGASKTFCVPFPHLNYHHQPPLGAASTAYQPICRWHKHHGPLLSGSMFAAFQCPTRPCNTCIDSETSHTARQRPFESHFTACSTPAGVLKVLPALHIDPYAGGTSSTSLYYVETCLQHSNAPPYVSYLQRFGNTACGASETF